MKIFVTGTDTGVGKTIFCAGLAGLLDAYYWKPIQSGLEGETDTATVTRLSDLPAAKLLPERYRLRSPQSPHLAAELDGITIDSDRLDVPPTRSSLIIEGAGGALVPLTRSVLFADVLARWRLPTIVCTRTTLGTINHTLMTLEALRSRQVPIMGVAMIGDEHKENARIIESFGRVEILGRLPWLRSLTPRALKEAFAKAFPLDVVKTEYAALAE